MRIGELKAPNGAHKKRKRVGCGPGSGHGKTACRGSKGQKARAGSVSYPWFEGGQMPLQRRVPKRGFTNIFKTQYQIINVRDLNRFSADTEVDEKALRESGLARQHLPIKLLGDGAVDRPVKVSVHACTKKARELVEKAGGQVRLITVAAASR
jgi:large subunit ribosomal protein L15